MAHTLTIEKLVHGGLGLARTDKGIVFVSGVVPGETVEAEVVGKRARCDFARPVRVIEKSPDRRQPFCPHADKCGGCNWQHIAYPRQTAIKEQIFRETLARQGHIPELPNLDVLSESETGYRLRAQFRVDPARQAAGFFQRGTNQIEPVTSCPLLVEGLNGFLAELGPASKGLPELSQVKAIAGTDGTIASSPVFDGLSQGDAFITAGARTFHVSGDSFFQSNGLLLDRFGMWAADKVTGSRCTDLYGGTGFFSIMLSGCFESATLVELEPSLVDLARANAELNGVPGYRTVCKSAEEYLSPSGASTPDCLIVDPPRQGLTRFVVEAIGRNAPPCILYISCDPATQARDAGKLVNQFGYHITHAALFDLYPNTHHLETALVLEKR